jgi:hypothetical protein
MWPFKEKSFPPPPVPRQLREMLKDYPELIRILQDVLNSVITDPMDSAPPIEVAIWRLEDALSGFTSHARRELEAAKVNGDPVAIEQADAKLDVMLGTNFKGRWLGDADFSAYFQTHWRASS